MHRGRFAGEWSLGCVEGVVNYLTRLVWVVCVENDREIRRVAGATHRWRRVVDGLV
jgi:hypothetical protein